MFIIRFLHTMLALIGMFAAIAGEQTVLRLRAVETVGRAESLLATALSRPRLFGAAVAPWLTLVGGFLAAWGGVAASFLLALLGDKPLPFRAGSFGRCEQRGHRRCISRGLRVDCGPVHGVSEAGRGIINKVMEIGAPSRNRTRDTRGRNPLL